MIKSKCSIFFFLNGIISLFVSCANSPQSSGSSGTNALFIIKPVVGSWLYEGIPTGVFFSFYLYLPDDYGSTVRKYPLVVYLQGGPINGPEPVPELLGAGPLFPLYQSNNTIDSNGRDNMNGYVRQSIVIYPLMPYYDPTYRDPIGYYNPDTIDKIVAFIMSNYSVDSNRLYLCGSSEGGGGAWGYAWGYSGKVAAVVPVSCGLSWPVNDGLKSMPTWIFHSFNDTTVPHETTSDINFNALTGINNVMDSYPHLNGDPSKPADQDYTISYNTNTGLGIWTKGTVYPTGLITYTLYASGGHDAWTRTYGNNTVWEWVYSQTK